MEVDRLRLDLQIPRRLPSVGLSGEARRSGLASAAGLSLEDRLNRSAELARRADSTPCRDIPVMDTAEYIARAMADPGFRVGDADRAKEPILHENKPSVLVEHTHEHGRILEHRSQDWICKDLPAQLES
jgi:hypothetical protein